MTLLSRNGIIGLIKKYPEAVSDNDNFSKSNFG